MAANTIFSRLNFETEQLESSISTLVPLSQLWFWHQFDAKRPFRPKTNVRWPPSTSWKNNVWTRAHTIIYKYTFPLNQPQGFRFWHYFYGLISIWPCYQDGCYTLVWSVATTLLTCIIIYVLSKGVVQNMYTMHNTLDMKLSYFTIQVLLKHI